jgi:hypothetical protein
MIPMNPFNLKRSHRIVLWLVLLLAVGGILTALYMYNLKDKDMQKVKPDFTMTASELQKEFETDESVAGAKYINRIIEVTGEVESVNPGEDHTVIITLKTNNPFSGVSCTLEADTGSPELAAGNQVSLRGQCSGFLMDVIMNNCTVISNTE